MTLPLNVQGAATPPDKKGTESFHRWVISSKSIPLGIKVVGTIRYQFFRSSGAVYGLTRPLHIPSKVSGETPSSEDNPGEFLYLTVLTVRSAGVAGPEAFPDIFEIDTLIRSTSGILSLVI